MTPRHLVENIADLRIGDRIIYTYRSGRRVGVRIDHVSGDLVASGRRVRIGDPNVHLDSNIIVTRRDARHGRIERLDQ